MMLWIFLQTPYGQNKVLPLALNYLSSTLGTEIKASRINVSFFDELQLDDVVVYDHTSDTLLFIKELDADIGLFSLFNKKLSVDKIKLNGAQIHLKEGADAVYNFQHIIDHLDSGSTTDTDTQEKGWAIDLGAIELDNTLFHLEQQGGSLHLSIPSMDGDLKSFSIDDMIFHFHSLSSSGIIVDYEKSTSLLPETEGTTAQFPGLPFGLIIDEFVLDSHGIGYHTDAPHVADPPFDPNHIEIETFSLKGKDFSWNDSLSLNIQKMSTVLEDGYQIEHFSSNIKMTPRRLHLQKTRLKTLDSDLRFDADLSYPSFDAMLSDLLNNKLAIDLQQSTLSQKDILYFLDQKEIKDIDLQQLNDLSLAGRLVMDGGQIAINDIMIDDGQDLRLSGSMKAIGLLDNTAPNIGFDLSDIYLSQDYLHLLLPNLQLPAQLKNQGAFSGNMKGRYFNDTVTFDAIQLRTTRGNRIAGKGSIYDLGSESPSADFSRLSVDIDLDQLFTSKMELPEEIKRLKRIKYDGSLRANLGEMEIIGLVQTALGDAELDAQMCFLEDYAEAEYTGYINTIDFDLGTMLADSTLGVINFAGNINGRGFDPNTLEADIDGRVASIGYGGKTYRDITVQGIYNNKIFEGKIISEDEKLGLNLDGRVDLSGDEPIAELTMDMKNFDLSEIGISDSLFVLGGIFRGKVKGNSVDNFLGEGTIEGFSMKTSLGHYEADSIIHLTAADVGSGVKKYAIESPFFDGNVTGKMEPSSLIRFVKNYIKAYIPLEIGYDEKQEDNLDLYFETHEDQDFIFSGTTKDINPFLAPLFGDKMRIQQAKLGIYFSSADTKLDLKGTFDSLYYSGFLLEHGSYFFDGRKSFINGNVNIENIIMNNEVLVPQTTMNTALSNKVAAFDLVLSNEEDVERLNLRGDLSRTDEYIITFKDSVYLNGFNWQFSPYNKVIFGDYGLFLQDLSLSKGNQSITLYTDENENGEAIEALFDNFSLAELTAIIDKKNEFLEGKIDGSLLINSIYSNPFITADLGLRNVTIADHEAGDIMLVAKQDNVANTVNSILRLTGPQNDATISAIYGIGDKSISGLIDVGKLEMAIIDPYLTEVFIDSEGSVKGRIEVKGNLHNLGIKGQLRTNDIMTTPVFTNSRYKVLDTDIVFSDTAIDFGRIELQDKDGNSAFVSGKIHHESLRHSIVDLSVQTDKFEFLNTTENENELFYGNVNIKGNITAHGPIDDIELDGSVEAIDHSRLVVSPLSLEEDLLSDDFIIYSGDPRKIPSDSLQLDSGPTKVAIPFDVEIKLSVEEDSEFSMILDPITGDRITCHGKANLTLKLTKNGEMEIFGTYTVSEGTYAFSYGIITREFVIQPNSTVSFNGDPLKGELDVEAIYLANTAIYDLIKLESNKLSDAQKSEAQRKRDVNVVLNLTKRIERPEINLDIRVDEEKYSPLIADILSRKLNQLREEKDELNNQVFGLLLFNNFILSKNADTDLAKTSTDIAISSISNLVAQQLNKMADGLIEGFEVNFNVNAYGSDFLSKGQEGVVTEFGLGVKKTLFDDRLTLALGTNINLESSTDDVDFGTIVGDFILGYKIDKDGNYKVQVYRKSTFDRLSAEGNAAKNGVGFYVRKEFGEIKQKKD